ncbi:hypothetical protein C0J52_21653, partial [Blattella germanica]
IEQEWPGKPIPEGYKAFFTLGYYKYHTTPKNWNEARETCISEGAHLAVVNSESEARLLASILPSDKFAWIGTHDFYQEGQWIRVWKLLAITNGLEMNQMEFSDKDHELDQSSHNNSTTIFTMCTHWFSLPSAIEKRWAGNPIPEGYKEYTQGHYKYHTTPKNWNNARETCISEGAHLAVVNSESEARLLTSILPGYKDIFAWIGIHDFYQEGKWIRVWKLLAITNGLEMNQMGKCATPCSNPSPQRVPTCHCSKLTDPPVGYIKRVHGQYYKYHQSPKTWNEAWTICRNEGGHLAILNSEEEAKFVGAIPKTKYNWAFVGFHDLYQEGKYVTLLDENLEQAGYNKWPHTDPNGGRGENCGVVFPNGLLGDWRCEAPTTFFCEINLCPYYL